MENQIIQGDALDSLRSLPSESVDMCITSPPYWGLRDYGVEGQLGQEPDFRDFIKNLADIFDEVKRVLKPTGTCWVNLGDTYGGIPASGGRGISQLQGGKTTQEQSGGFAKRGVPEKSLCNIPARFAIEMTDRGWILRNEIIWHKPNIMPQSVKDRFTVDYEKLFFFTKSKRYNFEQQFEPAQDWGTRDRSHGKYTSDRNSSGQRNHGDLKNANFAETGKNKRAVWKIATKPFPGSHFAVYPEALIETPILAGCPIKGVVLDPFFGSGTTGVVAQRLDRKYIGLELNPEYIEIAEKRLAKAKAVNDALLSRLPLEA